MTKGALLGALTGMMGVMRGPGLGHMDIPQNLSSEDAVKMLERPALIGRRRKPPTSRSCRCGRTISSNALACRSCAIDAIDKAITDLDKEISKEMGLGHFEQATELSKRQTKIQQKRADVVNRLAKLA